MVRPSVKTKRAEEILKAYERCIALYGVEGATLQKIADEAGIARPLLRHHIGNSDALLKMAAQRFIERNEQSMQDAYASLPGNCTGEDFMNLLFHSSISETQHNDVMIAAAFIHTSQTNAEIKKQMQEWLNGFVESFTKQLHTLSPEADSERVKNVAAGIIGIYFNISSLTPLEKNARFREQSYKAALYLLETLKN